MQDHYRNRVPPHHPTPIEKHLKLPKSTYNRLVKAAKSLGVYDMLAASRRLRRLKRRLVEPVHPLLPVLNRLSRRALSPPTLMDIGARGGIQPRWQPVAAWLDVIGFEPDVQECDFLNEHHRKNGEQVKVYPVALADADGDRTFYVTGLPNSSGIFAGDPAYLARLHDVHARNLHVVSQQTIHTRAIDSFLAEHPELRVDFIKIDVEGAEYEVLAGAKRLLTEGEVLGVEYEIWLGPVKHRPDRQALIDTLLRESRLHLFDFDLRRFARKTFPDGFIPDRADVLKFGAARAVRERYGQPLTGDAVYLRDPVWEWQQGNGGFRWDDETVLKMALIYSIYDLPDCAIELVQHYANHFPSQLPFDKIYDALTPPGPGGRRIGYRDYLARAARHATRATGKK